MNVGKEKKHCCVDDRGVWTADGVVRPWSRRGHHHHTVTSNTAPGERGCLMNAGITLFPGARGGGGMLDARQAKQTSVDISEMSSSPVSSSAAGRPDLEVELAAAGMPRSAIFSLPKLSLQNFFSLHRPGRQQIVPKDAAR
jgi:hypothetical protein